MPPTDASISIATSLLQVLFVLIPLWGVGLGYFLKNHYHIPDSEKEELLTLALAIGLGIGSILINLLFASIADFLYKYTTGTLTFGLDWLLYIVVFGTGVGLVIISRTESMKKAGIRIFHNTNHEYEITGEVIMTLLFGANVFFPLFIIASPIPLPK